MSWSGKVYCAIFEGNVKAARELLAPDQLTNFNLEGRHGYEEATLLMIAANECQVEIVNLLLDAGAFIHTRDRCCETALIWAARSGDRAVVEMLVNRGADIMDKNKFGDSALTWAARCGFTAAVELFINLGADSADINKDGDSALTWAVRNGHTEVVELLLRRGADMAHQDRYGNSLLITAAKCCRFHLVKMMVRRGADIAHRNHVGMNATDEAENIGYRSIAEFIREEAAGWRRVQNFVQFLHEGGFSSADWNFRIISIEANISITQTSILRSAEFFAIPVSVGSRSQRNVLLNRDLCKIVSSFIPVIHCEIKSDDYGSSEEDDDDDDEEGDSEEGSEKCDEDSDDGDSYEDEDVGCDRVDEEVYSLNWCR